MMTDNNNLMPCQIVFMESRKDVNGFSFEAGYRCDCDIASVHLQMTTMLNDMRLTEMVKHACRQHCKYLKNDQSLHVIYK